MPKRRSAPELSQGHFFAPEKSAILHAQNMNKPLKRAEKKTKIICTIGPASQDIPMLTQLIKSGMNVARLNFSHGSYDSHRMTMANIRAASKKLDVPIAIMQDLQGPKIRVASLEKPIAIKTGQSVTIGKDFSMDFDISASVKPGDRILIEDGLLELIVQKISGRNIRCKVMNGGLVQSHKGINIPDSVTKFPVMTEKDKRDLKFGLENDVDYVALSFVRDAKDITNIKSLIEKWNPKGKQAPLVIAKIEKPEAIQNFESILAATDVVMIARGDLGVELEAARVPILQKEIIEACLDAGKPAIVATQMMDSMIRNPRPTRAEVSDVANAVLDGADCVMLSGESAFGAYPLETVREMAAAIGHAENSEYALHQGQELLPELGHAEAKAIGAVVTSFAAATNIARERLASQMLFFVNNRRQSKLYRQLSLVWGVHQGGISASKEVIGATDIPAQASQIVKAARAMKFAEKGDEIVVLSKQGPDGLFASAEIRTV